MNKLNITESLSDAIINEIATNIKSELDQVAAYRGDFKIVLDTPQSYFIYENAIDLKAPAIYVIVDSIDGSKDRGQNHINVEIKCVLSIVFENKTAEDCVRGLYRYVDALWRLLDQKQIDRADGRAKDVIKVIAIDYSGLQQNKDQNESIFRKESMLTLQIEHFESEQN